LHAGTCDPWQGSCSDKTVVPDSVILGKLDIEPAQYHASHALFGATKACAEDVAIPVTRVYEIVEISAVLKFTLSLGTYAGYLVRSVGPTPVLAIAWQDWRCTLLIVLDAR
jgi:hypothetical protein